MNLMLNRTHLCSRLTLLNCSKLKILRFKSTITSKRKMDYLLALDFEATCDSTRFEPQEIIEFPVILVKCDSFQVEDKFHKYIRPVERPELTSFCTELTEITQEMVDMAQPFPQVWTQFIEWLEYHKLVNNQLNNDVDNFAFVTCGNWDLGVMLPDQCSRNGITLPQYMKRWINVKVIFHQVMGQWPRSLKQMLDELKIQPVGRPHRGLDDAMNVVLLMKELSKRGGKVDFTNFQSYFRRLFLKLS